MELEGSVQKDVGYMDVSTPLQLAQYVGSHAYSTVLIVMTQCSKYWPLGKKRWEKKNHILWLVKKSADARLLTPLFKEENIFQFQYTGVGLPSCLFFRDYNGELIIVELEISQRKVSIEEGCVCWWEAGNWGFEYTELGLVSLGLCIIKKASIIFPSQWDLFKMELDETSNAAVQRDGVLVALLCGKWLRCLFGWNNYWEKGEQVALRSPRLGC